MIHKTRMMVSCSLACCLFMTAATPRETGQDGTSVERDGRTFAVRKDGMPPITGGSFDPLLPTEGLAGWMVTGGDATIERKGDELHGQGNAGRNTFLMSEDTHGDFILEGEVRINKGGNSGWQVRSHQVRPGERTSGIRGYQIEVDSSDRSWSGGFYDELRRGWIHPFQDDEEARGAFKTDAWNHYRIECIGPHVRTWVNGVACADVIDFADLEGLIAFQVHSGRCDVRWRNLRIRKLGRSTFAVVPSEERRITPKTPWVIPIEVDEKRGSHTLRIRYRLSGSGAVRIETGPDGTSCTVQLAEKGSDGDGRVSGLRSETSRYPIAATRGGTERMPEDVRELIIDIEGPRLVVLVDGSIISRVRAETPIDVRKVTIEATGDDSTLELIETSQCRRTQPVTED